jgi:hypothetical protein
LPWRVVRESAYYRSQAEIVGRRASFAAILLLSRALVCAFAVFHGGARATAGRRASARGDQCRSSGDGDRACRDLARSLRGPPAARRRREHPLQAALVRPRRPPRGDEFVCALSHADLDDAHKRFDQIKSALAESHQHGSISVGFAQLQAGGHARRTHHARRRRALRSQAANVSRT